VMVVSNSCGTKTLKFNDAVGVLLSEEAHRKSSGSTETSGSTPSVDQRGRLVNRDKKKNGKSRSKSEKGIFKFRSFRCWRCGENAVRRDWKQKKDGEEKSKKEGLHVCHGE